MPPLGLIAGSRGYDLVRQGAFGKPSLERADTPYGPSSPLFEGEVLGQPAVLVSRHGAEGYEIAAPFVNYRANIYALKDRGVERIIAWSGPGAINPGLEIGSYVLPDDLLDETRGRAGTFYEGSGLGFIRQFPVFCPEVREALREACDRANRPVRTRATYVCTQGPRLETPAEVRKFAGQGADLVGMTLVPEVFLARELEMCYAAICYVTNYAEGLRPQRAEPGVLFEGLATAEERQAAEDAVAALPQVLARALELLAGSERGCTCRQSMERYRRGGLIGEDWHQWIRVPPKS